MKQSQYHHHPQVQENHRIITIIIVHVKHHIVHPWNPMLCHLYMTKQIWIVIIIRIISMLACPNRIAIYHDKCCSNKTRVSLEIHSSSRRVYNRRDKFWQIIKVSRTIWRNIYVDKTVEIHVRLFLSKIAMAQYYRNKILRCLIANRKRASRHRSIHARI